MKRNFESIQVLRGLAAVAVVLHHAVLEFEALPILETGPRQAFVAKKFYSDVGAIGVDLFFIISGFIMTYTARRGGFARAGDFLLRRALRIYPLYWLCSVLMIAMLFLPSVQAFHAQPIQVFKSFLLFPTLYDGLVRPVILPQGWTLTYEILFYLLFALTLWQTRSRQLISIFGILAGLFIFASFVRSGDAGLIVLRDPLLFEFVAGLLLGTLLAESTFRLNSKIAWTVIGLGLLLLVPSAFVDHFVVQTPRLWRFGLPAFFIVGGAVLHPAAASVRFPRFLNILGDASYSIYLIHPVVFLFIYTLWTRLGLPFDFYFLLISGAALATGLAFYFIVERPLLNGCRSLIEPREKLPAAA